MEGKAQLVSERYLGSAADIEARWTRGRRRSCPSGPGIWGSVTSPPCGGCWQRLGVIDTDRRGGRGAPPRRGRLRGHLPGVGRAEPVGRPVFQAGRSQTGGRTTAADRFTRIRAGVLDHRKFWEAMHAVTAEQLAAIEHRLALAMIEIFGLDISALALDMTNFATYIDSTNDRHRSHSGARPSRNAPTCAWSGSAWCHPRRRDPAGLPRLPRQPARRHPVHHHDRPADGPAHRGGRALTAPRDPAIPTIPLTPRPADATAADDPRRR